jgi:hypothetical protein
MVFADVLREYPDILDPLSLDTTAHTDKFKEVLIGKFKLYEIGLETPHLFQEALVNKLAVKKDYYLELIHAYETQVNMLDGLVSTTTTEHDGSGSNSNVVTPRTKTESIHYELPRSATADNYPSSKDTSEVVSGTDSSEGSYSDEFTNESTTKTGNAIDQKVKYMKMLRNVWEEFANEFKSCFLDLYA